ncbi:MAG: hypothetical protein HPY75_08140 [Actinobacteria bacterium]|nr:hypothetical protein [Actinomycetota bacterium]
MKDYFFDVPRTGVMTTQGRVDLPMFFYDVSARIINFFVEAGGTLPMLEGTGLEPVRFFGDKALVSLAFLQYREVSIGGYDEVFITIMVVPMGFPKPRFPYANFLRLQGARWTMGGYVLEMPVTIPQARAAGREIWGYPKFETEIPFRLSGRRFEYSVFDPENGETLVKVSAKETPGIKLPAFDMVSFSNHDGKILKTITEVDGWYRNCMVKDVRIEVGKSDHRLARNARELGLGTAKPWGAMCSDALRTKLHPGVPVAEHETPPMPYTVEGEEWAKPLP